MFEAAVRQNSLQFIDALEAVAWFFLEAAEDEPFEIVRDAGTKRCRRHNFVVGMGQNDLHRIIAHERHLAGQQEIGHGSQAIDIAAGIERFADALFGRHVSRRTGDGPILRSADQFLRLAKALDQAEIEQLGHVINAAAFASDDIARLDIAMDEADGVGFAESAGNLAQKRNRSFGRQRPRLIDQLLQAQAGKVFHHVIEGAIFGVAVVEDFNGIPVRERSHHAHFAFETKQGFGVAGAVGTNHLDGAGPPEQNVLTQVDLTHAARAELLFKRILPEFPGFEGPFVQLQNLIGSEYRHQDADGQQNQFIGYWNPQVFADERIENGLVQRANNKHAGHRACNDRRAFPRVRNKRAIDDDDAEPALREREALQDESIPAPYRLLPGASPRPSQHTHIRKRGKRPSSIQTSIIRPCAAGRS